METELCDPVWFALCNTQQIFRVINIDYNIAAVSFMLSAEMARCGFKVLTTMLESVRW